MFRILTQTSTFGQTLHIKSVNFTICKLYLNKLDFKNKDNEKTLKIPKEKKLFSDKQNTGIFSMPKESNCQLSILYPVKPGQI